MVVLTELIFRAANVYHCDMKPENIHANANANANCRLTICDFGLARVAFTDIPHNNILDVHIKPFSNFFFLLIRLPVL